MADPVDVSAMTKFLEGGEFHLEPWQRQFVEAVFAHDGPIDIAQVMRANDRRARNAQRLHLTALQAIAQAEDHGDPYVIHCVSRTHEGALADADHLRRLIRQYAQALGLPGIAHRPHSLDLRGRAPASRYSWGECWWTARDICFANQPEFELPGFTAAFEARLFDEFINGPRSASGT